MAVNTPLTALQVMQDAPVIPVIVLHDVAHAVPMARAAWAGPWGCGVSRLGGMRPTRSSSSSARRAAGPPAPSSGRAGSEGDDEAMGRIQQGGKRSAANGAREAVSGKLRERGPHGTR